VGSGAGAAAQSLRVWRAVNLATIDIGTNTTLLLVARVSDGHEIDVLDQRAEITRLGRGIGGVGYSGRLGAEGIAATLEVLRTYAAVARQHGASDHLAAVGTEALRRAPNADEFLRPAAAILGAPVEVIDGDREAELTFRATLESFPAEAAAGWLAVVDIGGGSTEIVLARAGQVRFQTSLPLGSVRLTERHVRHDPIAPAERKAIEDEVASALAAVPFPAPAPGEPLMLVGVAGTVTTLAAMSLQMAAYDADSVHGFVLGAETLDELLLRLGQSTQAQRERMVGLDPRRADVILAGGLILRGITQRAGAGALRVSDRGIRWGLLYELVRRG
jgi:exopolyphosphatase / guanosine-5'-triphosphate,3'-diphosphate pyrophosphatase